MDDSALLQSYARDRSEAAFAEFVRRHVDLVYSAALRQVGGDHHRAQEVTQVVFTGLARKAAALARHPAPLAWIFQSVRFAAANLRREEGRRRLREGEAAREWTAQEPPVADWDRLRPVLDDALNELREGEREAILLRYFSSESYAEVGRRLGLHENAARMRVERALEKLQGQLSRRGITSTAAALGAVLAGNAVAAAPVGVATATVGAALSAAGGGGLIVFSAFMSSTKIQAALVAVLAAAGATTALLQQRANARLQDEISAYLNQNGIRSLTEGQLRIAGLRRENQALERDQQEAAALRAANARLAERHRPAAAQVASAGQAAVLASGPVYPLDEVDQHPVPVAQPAPQFPADKKAAGVGGQAVVGFVVAADGSVGEVTPVSSSDPEFADAAVAAVQHWRFQPGRKGGVPVGVRMQVPIVFTLGRDAPSKSWF